MNLFIYLTKKERKNRCCKDACTHVNKENEANHESPMDQYENE